MSFMRSKAHTMINCFLYWIVYCWYVALCLVFQVECAACTLDTAIYLGTTCAASSATAVLTATTTLGARMTEGSGFRDFTQIQSSLHKYLTLFDIIWHYLTFRMPMCPVSLVDRLMGSNIRCIDFSNRCPWLHLHTIRDDSWRFRPIDSLSLCFSWKHWWMDDDSSFAPVTMTLSPATLGLRLKLWNRGMTKGWTDEGHLTSVIHQLSLDKYIQIWL